MTRQIVGPLLLSVGGSLTDASYHRCRAARGSRTTTSRCRPACPGCPPPPGDPSATDALGRLTLLFDTRDNEFVTTKGVLAEGGLFAGSAGAGYNGYYGIARGYLPLWIGASWPSGSLAGT